MLSTKAVMISRPTLDILRDRIPKLPVNFTLIVASRVGKDIDYLSDEPHVTIQIIDARELANLADTEVFVRYMLKDVAR